jgi:hypothetical protein
MNEIMTRVNADYDGQTELGTNHAIDGVNQKWWVQNWKAMCNAAMQDKGWM